EAVQRDRVLAHDGLDQHGHLIADRELAQRARRRGNQIADAADIDDGAVEIDGVDHAFQLGDQRAASTFLAVARGWAWQMATASAAAASLAASTPGSLPPTII